MFEKTYLNVPCCRNSEFEFNCEKNIYENYVNPLFGNMDEKNYVQAKSPDCTLLSNPSYIPVKDFSSVPSNSSSSLDVRQGYEYKNSSFSVETVSLSDVVLKSTGESQQSFNAYSGFNSSYQRNNLGSTTTEMKENFTFTSDMHEINFPAPYILNIFGIPEKSRVETQVKLEMKLSYNFLLNSSPVSSYSWFKLPRWSITKEKLKLPNLKDIPKNIDPEKILIIEPSVVCASDVKKSVLICSGCIIRERKRAIRKRRNKSSVESSSGNYTKDGALIPIEDEEKKIIVFNHPELSEFKNNCINIPTRITCYCRHHKENIGFRILINLKDNKERLIASTLSRSFMITDDHKTNAKAKIKEMNRLHSTLNLLPQFLNLAGCNSQKWKNTAPRGQLHKKIQKIPKQLSTEKSKSKADMQKLAYSSLDSITNNCVSHSTSEDGFFDFSAENLIKSAPTSLIYVHKNISHENISHKNEPYIIRDRFVESTSIEDLFMSENALETDSGILSRESPFISDEDSTLEMTCHAPYIASESSLFKFSAQPQRFKKRFKGNVSQMSLPNQIDISMPNILPIGLSSNPDDIPTINYIVPSEGNRSFILVLVCTFGDNSATSTHCWSPTVIVCTLPPSSIPGSVIVKFKDHDLANSSVKNKKYFTYKDDNDRTLMELALQVVGLKMTGKLENARTVAMKICGLMPNNSYESNLIPQQLSIGLSLASSEMAAKGSLAFDFHRANYYFETMFLQSNNFLNLKQTSNAFYLLYQDRPNQILLHLTYIEKIQRYIIELFSQKYYFRTIKHSDYKLIHCLSLKKINSIERVFRNTGENEAIYMILYKKIFNLTYPNDYLEISNFLRLSRNHIDYIIVKLILGWLCTNNSLVKKRSTISSSVIVNTSNDEFFDNFFLTKESKSFFIKNQFNKKKSSKLQIKQSVQKTSLDSYTSDKLSIVSSFFTELILNDQQDNKVVEFIDSTNEKTEDGIFTVYSFSEFLTSAKAKLASLFIPNILRNSIFPQFLEFSQFCPITTFNSFIQQYPHSNKKLSYSESPNAIENDIQYNWRQLLIYGPPPPYSEISTDENISKLSFNDFTDHVLLQDKSQWHFFKWQSKTFSKFGTNELTLEQQRSIREYAKIIQEIERDRMLYLFW
ncbi:unnamed protein product, partial [Pneumocystis jirovecii]